MTLSTDTVTRSPFCDRLLVLLVVFTCMRVWVGDLISLPTATAQVPDSGLQRKQLLDEAQRSNQLLSEIADILKNRALKVTPVAADEKSGSGVRKEGAKQG